MISLKRFGVDRAGNSLGEMISNVLVSAICCVEFGLEIVSK